MRLKHIIYVNDKIEVHESFVGFYRAEKPDDETLTNELTKVLISLGYVKIFEKLFNVLTIDEKRADVFAQKLLKSVFPILCVFVCFFAIPTLHPMRGSFCAYGAVVRNIHQKQN